MEENEYSHLYGDVPKIPKMTKPPNIDEIIKIKTYSPSKKLSQKTTLVQPKNMEENEYSHLYGDVPKIPKMTKPPNIDEIIKIKTYSPSKKLSQKTTLVQPKYDLNKAKFSDTVIEDIPMYVLESPIYQHVCFTITAKDVGKIKPPDFPMAIMDAVLSMVPKHLIKSQSRKFQEVADELAAIFANVQDLLAYETTLKSPYPKTDPIWMKPYPSGFAENREQFLAARRRISERLFIFHPTIRRVHDIVLDTMPTVLYDFTKIRDEGHITIDEYNNVVLVSVVHGEMMMMLDTYVPLVRLLSGLFSMEGVPRVLAPRFRKLLTIIILHELKDLFIRTLDNYVESTRPEYLHSFSVRIFFVPHFGFIQIPHTVTLRKIFRVGVQTITEILQDCFTVEYMMRVEGSTSRYILHPSQQKINRAFAQVDENILAHYSPIDDYVHKLMSDFEFILQFKKEMEFLKFLRTPKLQFRELCRKMNCLKPYYDKIMEMTDVKEFPHIQIYQGHVIRMLRQHFDAFVSELSNTVLAQHKARNFRLCDRFTSVTDKLLTIPKNTEELVMLGDYLNWTITTFVPMMKELILALFRETATLMHWTELSSWQIYYNIVSIQHMLMMKKIILNSSLIYEARRFELSDILFDTIRHLRERIQELFRKTEILNLFDSPDGVLKYNFFLKDFMGKILKCDQVITWINKEEKLFNYPITTYPAVEELKTIISPIGDVIFPMLDWQRKEHAWMDGDFEFVSSSFIEDLTENTYRQLSLLQKESWVRINKQTVLKYKWRLKGVLDETEFDTLPSIIKLCIKMLEIIREFKKYIPLIIIVCNRDLEERHWREMNQIVRLDLTPDASTTLRKLLDLNLEPFLESFEVISMSATKERELKENLEKLMKEWDDIRFTISFWKDTDVAILTQVDDLQQILEEHYVRTLTIRGSAFVKPYQKEVNAWFVKLVRMMDTIEEWAKVQSQWLYLLPIFSSPDISTQLPGLVYMFEEADEIYSGLMKILQADPVVIHIAGTVGCLENLQECTYVLEKINAGVSKYLERKRFKFPRFFFLSNDEMLEILCETKDPRRVQPHLKKCFEGINRVDIDPENVIHSMLSAEDERINLAMEIDVKKARGAVEIWLLRLEQIMVLSVKSEIMKSHEAYPKSPREEWVLEWAGQVVLCVSMIYWTAQVENSLSPTGLEELQNCFDLQQNKLSHIVEKIRGKLTKLQRITLCALVVLDVHAKDVTEELLNKKVSSAKDFQWLCQLRYYKNSELTVSIVSATVLYACEYLGNTPRLVITPLTDRCYRTLMAAYHLHLNGAPEGPAGTGKTETTKDLAKALAVQCIVFNCSEGLDYKAMGKFFKGLASTGAWVCFDEFNRIEVEVLSVIAQQILCIVEAVRAGERTFVFEGTHLHLNPACYICITMNPGYAGRSELPDNLKVLFRTVAMMVPDYAMIGEISLYSYGFSEARKLSVKIVTTYRLCSEQLSSQNHYDYGMRAVKTVLAAAGNLKLKFPHEKEENLLLKSIIDVNLPKFLSYDIPLFEGIISDLFPNVSLPSSSFDIFKSLVREVCSDQNLQPTEFFITKLIQTYEMMIVRHGFMLVGEPFGGKTCCLKVLAETLGHMEDQGEPENRVQYVVVNPKSVTMDQLYGELDTVSYEWTDGIVAITFRRFSTDTTSDRKWLIFDGPVDAVWIENMNTVLDDNKKLCLTSGEVISQTPSMSMIFEVMDLAQASPATVSRCGMIYFEPASLGWKPLVTSWIKNSNAIWRNDNEVFLAKMFDWLAPACLEFVRKNCVQLSRAGTTNTIMTKLHLVTFLMDKAVEAKEELVHLGMWLQAAILYAGVWSYGGNLNNVSREKFDDFYKSLWKGEIEEFPYPPSLPSVEVSIPSVGTLYDYIYSFKQRGFWKYWPDMLKDMRTKETKNIEQIMVPTIESVRLQHLMEKHIENNVPMLVVGPTGTGKSFFMQNMLMHKLSNEKYTTAFLTFTPRTSANQTQELVISKLSKRRKGIYAPPINLRCVMLIDDINMPAKEIYGAQPPLELLRQYFDYGNWYDLKDMAEVTILDVLILAAMGPPGGSRQDVYSRFLRHFAIYSIDSFSEESTEKIYTKVLLICYKRNGFLTDVIKPITSIISATLDIYNAATKDLLPTPAKSHYVFNIRDFSRVIQGCALLKVETAATDKRIFIKVWVHEILRIFYDRLIDTDDRTWLYNKLRDCISKHFNESFDVALNTLPLEDGVVTEASLQSLIFGNFLDPNAIDEDRKYEEVASFNILAKIAENAMTEYNLAHKTKLDILLFRYALEHLARVCRIIAMSCGSGLFVGMAGSGRQSLAKLASAMYGIVIFQPQITTTYGVSEWRNDVKQILKNSGALGKDSVFLFSETQIKEEVFLEDIESLLNSGEVPNLYAPDEIQEIIELARYDAQGGNRRLEISIQDVFTFFQIRCKQKLHMLLCFSPIGSSFRNRLRMYPSLVNCCTIDWYMTWPDEALEMISQNYLQNSTIPRNKKLRIAKACRHFHLSAGNFAEEVFEKEGWKTYVTSAMYMEFINSFKKLTIKKRKEILLNKQRYVGGLATLNEASSQIGEMKEELSDLTPQLEAAAATTARTLVQIEEEQIILEETSRLMKRDEESAKQQAEAAAILKNDCEKDLKAAEPALNAALAALETLKPKDIALVKTMKNPPEVIKLVMEAVCVMKDIPPARVRDPNTGRMLYDYWIPSKRVLGDMNFLQSLKTYDKDNIPPSIMTVIRNNYLTNPKFSSSIIAKASKAAEGLCKWIYAMDQYDRVMKMVTPKKEKLLEAETTYKSTMELLESKREAVKKMEEQVLKLQRNLVDAQLKKKGLDTRVADCKTKLKRARKLIESLGEENDRWSEASDMLQNGYNCLHGDMLVCCGLIIYLAPFSAKYRAKYIKDWQSYCEHHRIPCSKMFNFQHILGSDVKIESWNSSGLPRDTISADNAIIADNSRRYSILVDPQGQANKWIKTLEKGNNDFLVVKFTDSDYMKLVLSAMKFGYSILIENIGDDVDPSMEPILQKKSFRIGGMNYIKMGETLVEFHRKFKLYMTSNLRNPHYSPEVLNLVTVVNFSLTLDGLADQLLGSIMSNDMPELEKKRVNLITERIANKASLKEFELKILHTIADSENILSDTAALQVLDECKILVKTISQREDVAAKTAKEIEDFRRPFIPTAEYIASLYYCICDLPNLNPMYQYSLQWFLNLFKQSLQYSKRASLAMRRADFIEDVFTKLLYTSVCRSLFEKDKLLFSFLLCTSTLLAKKKVDEHDFNFFLTGGVSLGNKLKNPADEWLPKKAWDEICHIDALPAFYGFKDSFTKRIEAWHQYFNEMEPQDVEMPFPWQKQLGFFQILMLIKILRPDKMLPCITNFVCKKMGQYFVSPPAFKISECYKDADARTPLIFILSAGADPITSLTNFAKTNNVELHLISLGQGQGPHATKVFELAQQNGEWVCLQNCHLAASFMTTLEKLWEGMSTLRDENTFRLWMTSYPSDKFPTSVLQAAVKMTNEPPIGLRQNLLRSYISEPINDPHFFKGCERKPVTFAKLLYGLAFFHAVIQERRNFGSIGWNIPYGFNESDFHISIQQLQMFINEQISIPFDAITYLTGECNYGGRVTDDWDRRALNTILADFVNKDVVTSHNYQFCNVGLHYGFPDKHKYKDYVNHIKSMPPVPPVEVFGLHMNAGITRDLLYARRFMDSLMLVKGGMISREMSASVSLIYEIARDILNKLPHTFNLELAKAKYPVKYEESMNTVLVQEMDRFNKLTRAIESSLVMLQKGLKGFVVMTPELEIIATSLLTGKIPAEWERVSYPSLKPLGSYINDLLKRLQMLQNWYDYGKPKCFWLPGFFFTQAFLTGVLQNVARKYTKPIDQLSFDFLVTSSDFLDMETEEEGCLVYGLFLDGARWDRNEGVLTEAVPRVLWETMPCLLITPTLKMWVEVGDRYICPLYKTSVRRGVLSTTGHSTNYVLPFLLNTSVPVSHWIKRGVALLCQLDD